MNKAVTVVALRHVSQIPFDDLVRATRKPVT